MTAAQLVALARPVGLSATNVKSHLTRMVAQGVLDRHGPARLATYEPSSDQKLVIREIHARLERSVPGHWDGKWLMVTFALPSDRRLRERLRSALYFDGFRALSNTVFVRPQWPSPWAEQRAKAYTEAAAGYCVSANFIAGAHRLDKLYDLDGLDAAARAVVSLIGRRGSRCRSPRAAFIERLKVGGRVARTIGHDPRLPAEIWSDRRPAMRELVKAFRQFERGASPQSDLFIRQTIPGDRAIVNRQRMDGFR